MGTVHALLVLVAASAGTFAQQEQKVAAVRTVARLLTCNGFARYDDALAADTVSRAAAARFAEVAKAVLATPSANGQAASRFRVQDASGGAGGGGRLIAQGSGDEVAAVSAALEQTSKEEPLRARLQFSWVTVSKAVAQAQGLKLAEVTPVDENVANALVREATKTKGALVNLPEIVAGPLAPFVVEPTGKTAADVAREQVLRLRGEMVPLSEQEVGVSMQLVRGLLPADRTVLPPRTLRQLAFRLETGKIAASMVLAEGDDATVLVVRCIDASPAPLAKAEPPAKPVR